MVSNRSIGSEFIEIISYYWDVLILTIIFAYLFLSSRYNSEILINLILLFISAFLIEVYYISRFGVLPNVLIIILILKDSWSNVPEVIQLYGIIGGLIGIVLFLMGVKDQKTPRFIYSFTYLFYGLKTVISFYITYLIIGQFNVHFGILFVILLITIWYIGVMRFNNKNPFEDFIE